MGCAPRQPYVQQSYETQAEKQKKEIINKVNNANSAYKSCFDIADNETSVFKRTSEFLLLRENQSNKLDLLSSKTRLNAKQKSTLKEFGAATAKCRQVFLSNLNGVPSQPVFSKTYRLKDTVYAKLLGGQITVGQANGEIAQIDQNRANEMKDVWDRWNANMRAQHDAERSNLQQQRQRQIENQQRQQQIDAERNRANWEAFRQATTPAPVTNLTPGLTQGNNNYELPGTFKGQQQNSNPRNCTSIINGNVVNTNCY